MRWIKHMTASRRDEKLAAYFYRTGLEGYGFWWALLEAVAEQMKPDDNKGELTYPSSLWARILGCHPHKRDKYLKALLDEGLVGLEYKESTITVKIPNIAKYRDEYSKRSRGNQDTVRTLSASEADTESEQEREQNESKKQDPASAIKMVGSMVSNLSKRRDMHSSFRPEVKEAMKKAGMYESSN